MLGPLKIFSGRSNKPLAEEICQYLNLPLGDMEVKSFPDGETFVRIKENVRGCDTFIIQSTSPPVNEHLMELLVIIDTLKRASAERVTAVIPYYGYARQDRKDQPRVPITAKLVANCLTVAGANRILTIDLHAGQIQGFFDIPVDNLFANKIIANYFKSMEIENVVTVSPDIGSVKRARAFSRILGTPLAIVDKKRPEQSVAEVGNVIGDVKDKNVIIFDDMVDTGGTLCEAVEALKALGAKDVYAGCTHGILSGNAVEKISRSPLKKLVITNTVKIDEQKMACAKIVILSVAKLLAEAIIRIHRGASVSALFSSI